MNETKNILDENKLWMSKGKIGCTFAALFARNPDSIGWKTVVDPEKFEIPEGTFILSMQFPGKNIYEVKMWALENGFYLEEIGDGNTGLRYKIDKMVSWVQYFGPDSHVKTRQAPIPELMMAVKLPLKYYPKVGFKGILHLAHASIENLRGDRADKLWETSFKNTEKRLGHKPGLKEAAKTTYNNQ